MRSRRNHLHWERAAYQISAVQPMLTSPCSLYIEIASLFFFEPMLMVTAAISDGLSARTFQWLLSRARLCTLASRAGRIACSGR
jgi:hypothetical protein